MKTFQEIREAKKPQGKVVFNKKINKVPVVITKGTKGFDVHIDGDFLDTFKSQKEAEKTAQTVVKELK
jgi:hypothetical protein